MKMKKRTKKIQTPVTEKDLVKHFEKYRKKIDNWASRYKVALPELPGDTPEPSYISEPLFLYQVHASH